MKRVWDRCGGVVRERLLTLDKGTSGRAAAAASGATGWSETRRNQKVGRGKSSVINNTRSCRKASAIFRRISRKRVC